MAASARIRPLKGSSDRLIEVASALVLGLAAYFLLDYLVYAFRVVAFPFDWGEDEGYQLYYALKLAEGRAIYFDPTRFPMVANPYPPLYPLFASLAVKLWGPSLAPLRSISFSASMLSSALVYAMVRDETRKPRLGLLAAFFFLGNRWTSPWYPLARVDSLAVFLSLLAIYLAFRSKGRGPGWLLSLLSLAAAVYTRQSSIYALPLVAGLGWQAGRKRLLLSILVFLAASAGVFLWLDGSTRGLFYKNIFSYTATDYSLGKLIGDSGLYARHFAPMIALSALCAALVLFAKVGRFWAYLLLFSAAVTVLGGKLGSSINYYIPLTAALAAAAGVAVGAAPSAVAARWRPALRVFLVLAAAAQLALFWSYDLRSPSEADLLNSKRVAGYIDAARGEVLTERRPAFAALGGKEVLYDAVLTSFLYFRGEWDPRPLVGAVEAGRFSALLLMGAFVPPQLKAAADKAYMEIDRTALGTWYGSMSYRVLVPKSINPETEPDLWGLAVRRASTAQAAGAGKPDADPGLGILLFNGGRMDKALAEFHASPGTGEAARRTLWNAGTVLYRKGLYERASRLYREASRYGPPDAGLSFHLANSFLRSGLLSKAAAEYKAAIFLDPSLAAAYKGLAILYLEGLKEGGRAVYYLRESLRIDPHQPEADTMKAIASGVEAGSGGR